MAQQDPNEAVILVDHGSRRAASNEALTEMVAVYREHSGRRIVEPAHMELAAPSIADAFDACVRRGAERVIVFPFFLSPGRHWHADIPALAAEAARRHPGVSYLVTAPLGVHSLLAELIERRIAACRQQATERISDTGCEICRDPERCRFGEGG